MPSPNRRRDTARAHGLDSERQSREVIVRCVEFDERRSEHVCKLAFKAFAGAVLAFVGVVRDVVEKALAILPRCREHRGAVIRVEGLTNDGAISCGHVVDERSPIGVRQPRHLRVVRGDGGPTVRPHRQRSVRRIWCADVLVAPVGDLNLTAPNTHQGVLADRSR